MSYVALMTNQFDELVRFYGVDLGFTMVEQWDRANGRGQRFDLGGMRLEILDNALEKKTLLLGDPADRFHVVVEVEDIEAARARLKIDAPAPQSTSWGCRLFQLRDPDGVPVTFLQWTGDESLAGKSMSGRLATGIGRGKQFTGLDWARRQFIDKLGIDPFPGTLNVIVDDSASMSLWDHLKQSSGVSIENPNSGPNDCNGRCFPVSIEGRIDAAIVLADVEDYPPKQVEIIAEIGLREALGIADGDPVNLEI